MSNQSDDIEALYHQALKLPADERPAFLRESCAGDSDLRKEVESLLAEHDEAPDFMNRPAWHKILQPDYLSEAAGRGLVPDPDLPFEKLGDFRLIRKLGEGGMGTVYFAVQESMGRHVALKVIRAEIAGQFEAEARFVREVMAASRLNHPNIVTVYSSGEHNNQRYLAMEFLPGQELETVVRQAVSQGEKIPVSTVLSWVHQIADALDCAHRAGIIHRDVKPSNIRIDAQDRAMLMDFGMVRDMAYSTLTVTGQFRGSPHYASPEQIKAGKQKIDARTDIYSLGVTMYEAVTGRVPFDGETTDQVFYQILEEEPVRPRRLNPAISRDLETVILTAIEKERDRRYRSMGELALDVERLQKGEAIRAKPAGMATRIWKRARRRPVLSTAVTVSFLAAVAFYLYVVLWSYPMIVIEKNKAVDAGEDAKRQRTAAVEANEAAQATLNFFIDALHGADPNAGGGRDVTLQELLDRTESSLDLAFPDKPNVRGALHHTVGLVYLLLGNLGKAENHNARAIALHTEHYGPNNRNTLDAEAVAARILAARGLLTQGEEKIRDVLERAVRSLGPTHQLTFEVRKHLGRALTRQGRLAEAEEQLSIVLEALRETEPRNERLLCAILADYGSCIHDQARLSEAKACYEEVLEMQGRFTGAQGVFFETMGNLAILLQEEGDLEGAEEYYGRAIAGFERFFGPEHPNSLAARSCLSYLYSAQDRLEEAEEIMRDVLDTYRRVVGENDRTLSFIGNLASLIQYQGRPEEALVLAEEALALSKKLFPDGNWMTVLMNTQKGCCLRDMGRFEEAEPLLLEGFKQVMQIFGEGHPYTVEAIGHLALLYEQWKNPDKAASWKAMLPEDEGR
jgi:eukaryotic-like serine/threonine-protein kinase